MKSYIKILSFIIIVLSYFCFVVNSYANVIIQENDPEEPEEKKELSMSLTYFNINDTAREVRIKLATSVLEGKEGERKRKRWIPVKDVIVNLYLGEISREGMLGSVATDNKGIATFPLVNKFVSAKDTLTHFTFIGRVVEDPYYEDTEEELEIAESKIEISSFIEDSVMYLKAKVVKGDETGEFIPVEDADLKFYVKRDYGFLPLTESNLSTDEDGEVILEFPFIIPGNSDGELTFVARLEDNEDLGMVESYLIEQWGTPTIITHTHQRALWASRMNAPIWVILVVNSILLGIWLTIMYIVYQLYIIRKIGSHE
jgi:hypothetical protein